MATRLVEVYDAFKDAGASAGKSRAAATAIAKHELRFNKVEADLPVMRWMIGAVLAGAVSPVMKAFF